MDSSNKQNGKKPVKRVSWVRIGFGIGVSVALLGYFGISGLLFAIERFEIPEEQLTIYTSLFYGIIFFIAFSGFRAETRRHRMLLSRPPYEEPSLPRTTKAKEKVKRIRRILWIVFSVVSLGWITPALVIYWMEPRSFVRPVVFSASLLGGAAGIVLLIKKSRHIKTPYDYFLFTVGLCLGIYLANSFGIGVWS